MHNCSDAVTVLANFACHRLSMCAMCMPIGQPSRQPAKQPNSVPVLLAVCPTRINKTRLNNNKWMRTTSCSETCWSSRARANNDLIYLNWACICVRSRLNEIDSGFLSAKQKSMNRKIKSFLHTFRFALFLRWIGTRSSCALLCRQAWSLCGKWSSLYRTNEYIKKIIIFDMPKWY